MRKPAVQRYLSAFFFGVSRLLDPSANETGANALIAAHRRTAVELDRSAADDWQQTGRTLRSAMAGREKS